MKAVSASIIVLSGAVLALQKSDFLVLVGMGMMGVGLFAWFVLISKPSEPSE